MNYFLLTDSVEHLPPDFGHNVLGICFRWRVQSTCLIADWLIIVAYYEFYRKRMPSFTGAEFRVFDIKSSLQKKLRERRTKYQDMQEVILICSLFSELFRVDLI